MLINVGKWKLSNAAVILLNCAWILWSGVADYRWDVISAWTTHQECMDDAKQILTKSKEAGRKVSGPYVEMEKDGVRLKMQLQCLPDTIDPRNPKK
jgi:hypothetical protein